MKRAEAKFYVKYAKEIKAFSEGKEIQIRSIGSTWVDGHSLNEMFDCIGNGDMEYRIKPELMVRYAAVFDDGDILCTHSSVNDIKVQLSGELDDDEYTIIKLVEDENWSNNNEI
ncbi:MAG: hypothetical protein BMS9Abin31_0480 [Gammaproteobacteria bacterium]|nr:MAG: hypothetical protein BMS9Abin31_0480 [Gammaproteobacteria bacterium]